MKTLTCICLSTLLSGVAAAQFNTNLDANQSGWEQCVLPSCNPGGTGVPTSTTIAETGTKWPPNSLELSVSGPEWTDFLAYSKAGATTSTYFQSDFSLYIPGGIPSENYHALEYDIFQYLSPYQFMWGSQCVMGAKWQIWDGLHSQWIDTALVCSLPAGKWHHVQWWVHRLDGDKSCDGYPCMYFDMLGIDGVYSLIALTEPSGPIPVGWSNDSGLNFQIDIGGAKSKATATEYIEHVNLIELSN